MLCKTTTRNQNNSNVGTTQVKGVSVLTTFRRRNIACVDEKTFREVQELDVGKNFKLNLISSLSAARGMVHVGESLNEKSIFKLFLTSICYTLGKVEVVTINFK